LLVMSRFTGEGPAKATLSTFVFSTSKCEASWAPAMPGLLPVLQDECNRRGEPMKETGYNQFNTFGGRLRALRQIVGVQPDDSGRLQRLFIGTGNRSLENVRLGYANIN
jgi:hypothetical protein